MMIHLLVVVVMVVVMPAVAAGLGVRLGALSRRLRRRHRLKVKELFFPIFAQTLFGSALVRKLVQEWTKIGIEKGTNTKM